MAFVILLPFVPLIPLISAATAALPLVPMGIAAAAIPPIAVPAAASADEMAFVAPALAQAPKLVMGIRAARHAKHVGELAHALKTVGATHGMVMPHATHAAHALHLWPKAFRHRPHLKLKRVEKDVKKTAEQHEKQQANQHGGQSQKPSSSSQQQNKPDPKQQHKQDEANIYNKPRVTVATSRHHFDAKANETNKEQLPRTISVERVPLSTFAPDPNVSPGRMEKQGIAAEAPPVSHWRIVIRPLGKDEDPGVVVEVIVPEDERMEYQMTMVNGKAVPDKPNKPYQPPPPSQHPGQRQGQGRGQEQKPGGGKMPAWPNRPGPLRGDWWKNKLNTNGCAKLKSAAHKCNPANACAGKCSGACNPECLISCLLRCLAACPCLKTCAQGCMLGCLPKCKDLCGGACGKTCPAWLKNWWKNACKCCHSDTPKVEKPYILLPAKHRLGTLPGTWTDEEVYKAAEIVIWSLKNKDPTAGMKGASWAFKAYVKLFAPAAGNSSKAKMVQPGNYNLLWRNCQVFAIELAFQTLGRDSRWERFKMNVYFNVMPSSVSLFCCQRRYEPVGKGG